MDSLYLLIPLSAAIVLAILAVFGWALHGGQFDDLEGEAERILTDECPSLDTDQARLRCGIEQSSTTKSA